ncbi:MAG: hypothetical protein ACREE2_14870 [Stellaceae bacterium]
MMFIVRSAGEKPASVTIKALRRTPAIVPGAVGSTDYFCIGEAETMAALTAAGWQLVALRDGWYEDDRGGGIAISGDGRYWEIRDTPFTVVEAVGHQSSGDQGSGDRAGRDSDRVDVRGAVFGV